MDSIAALARLPDWEARLDRVLAEWEAGRGLKLGQRDCALFAAACINAVWGRNLAAVTGPWRHNRDRQIILPGGCFAAFLRAHMREIPPGLARRGDVLVVTCSRAGNSPAINDSGVAVLPTRRGLARLTGLPTQAAFTLD